MSQVVHDDQHVVSFIGESLCNGHGSIGCNIGKSRCFFIAGYQDDGVVLHATFANGADYLGNGIPPLTNGAIDTAYPRLFLVQYRVYGNGGLAGLAVADYQFTLAQANGHCCINGFQPRSQRA